jgi:hypothetical protein
MRGQFINDITAAVWARIFVILSGMWRIQLNKMQEYKREHHAQATRSQMRQENIKRPWVRASRARSLARPPPPRLPYYL